MGIYLDNAATTNLCREAAEAMRPYYGMEYYNPSSGYAASKRVKVKLEESRAVIAGLIGAKAEEIFFTSGGTESDNWAVNEGVRLKGHIISTAIEHKAILNPLNEYRMRNGKVDIVYPDREGIVHPASIRMKINRSTKLVTVMMANNEIGTIQPIKDIGHMVHEHDIIFHTDAVQAFGHIPVNVDDLAVDMLSASSHKFHGPKGVGFLYARKETGLHPFMFGGGQERGMRGGTENVPGIIGMTAAAEVSVRRMKDSMAYCQKLNNHISYRILHEVPEAIINGSRESRLPNNISISFKGIDAQSLLVMLDMKGISASAGSACNTGSKSASHVLKAINVPEEYIGGTLRLTIDSDITFRQADYAVDIIKMCVSGLRKKQY